MAAASATSGPPRSWPNGRPPVVFSTESKWDHLFASFTLDHQGTLVTGLDFYVKRHGGSLQEAKDKFVELAEDAWITFNTKWVTEVKSVVPKDVARLVLGYARASDVFCRNHRDGFAKDDDAMAPQVEALFVDPINV